MKPADFAPGLKRFRQAAERESKFTLREGIEILGCNEMPGRGIPERFEQFGGDGHKIRRSGSNTCVSLFQGNGDCEFCHKKRLPLGGNEIACLARLAS